MSDIRQSFKWSYAGFGLRALLGFLISPLIIAKVGMEGYGVFLMLTLYSYNGIFQLLDLGIPLFVQKTARKSDAQLRNDRLYSLQVYFIILSTLLLLAAMTALKEKLFILGNFSYFGRDVVLPLLFFINLFGLLLTYPQTRLVIEGQLSIVKKYESILSIFWVVSILVLIYIFDKKFVEVFLAMNLFLMILNYIVFLKKIQFSFKDFFLKQKVADLCIEFKTDLRETLSSTLLLKLNGITFKQSDNLIISIFLGPSELALLDIGLKLVNFLKTILGKLNELIFVKFNRDRQNFAVKDLQNSYASILKIQIFFSILFSIVLISFSDEILKLWLRSGFEAQSVWHTRLSIFIAISLPFAHSIPSYLIAIENKMFEVVKIVTVVSIFNILTSVILVQLYKVEGVIISTVIQQLLLGWLLLKRCKFQVEIERSLKLNFISAFFLLVVISVCLRLKEVISIESSTLIERAAIFVFLTLFAVWIALKNELLSDVKKITGIGFK